MRGKIHTHSCGPPSLSRACETPKATLTPGKTKTQGRFTQTAHTQRLCIYVNGWVPTTPLAHIHCLACCYYTVEPPIANTPNKGHSGRKTSLCKGHTLRSLLYYTSTFDLRREDSLSIKVKMAAPNVSITQRFNCIHAGIVYYV